MPRVKHTRATPSWDHLSTAPRGAALKASLSRLTRSSCCLQTTSFYMELRGTDPQGSWYMSQLYYCARSTDSGSGGILLIRRVCSCVCLVGDMIPAWSSFQNTVCLWSLPVSVTEGVPKIRHNLGPVHSENNVIKKSQWERNFLPMSLSQSHHNENNAVKDLVINFWRFILAYSSNYT